MAEMDVDQDVHLIFLIEHPKLVWSSVSQDASSNGRDGWQASKAS